MNRWKTPVLNVSNLWAIGQLAQKYGCSVEEIDDCAVELGAFGSAINGVLFLDFDTAVRIGLLLERKRKQAGSEPQSQPDWRLN